MEQAKIILRKKKDAAVRRFHPWIFSGAIYKIEGTPKDGDWVEVVDANDQFLAVGHYQKSSISVRILSFQPIEDKTTFWIERLQNAYQYRQALGLTQSTSTTCYRLIHAEGDGLPGLIIDIYNGVAVVQCHSIGMHKDLPAIVEALKTVYGDQLQAIYNKSKDTLSNQYQMAVENGYLFGEATPTIVKEYNHSFRVDWETGQKTGFFIDQRENRRLLGTYAKDKTVLNAFCYSGGFSVYALNAGAKKVDSVDVSKRAIELTLQNVALNTTADAPHQAFAEDVLQYLKSCPTYELMIIDPPAFAKNLRKRHNAVQGYKRLNALAMQKLAPNGILFTFSCSQVVNQQLFEDTIVAAALEIGRMARVMHRLTQPPDHPVHLFHPEGSYLKGLVLQVQ